MRLSLGQDLRMVQKQVLAPRMIQSMEILQLPILALQERIEQEMEENPVLELQEEEPELPAEEAEAEDREPPDAPTEEERELVIDETHAQRGRFRAADEDGRGVARPLRGALARPRAARSKRPASASSTRWPTWSPGRSRCKIICTTSWAGSTWSRRCGRWPTGSSTTSTPTATCRAGWKTCSGPTPARSELALAQRALAVVQKLDPPGVGARDLRECLLLQLTPGMPYYEQLRTLIANHLEDLEHNRLPVICRRTGYSIELIQQALDELRKLNPKPGADFNDVVVPPVTPDVFVELDDRRQVPRAAGGRAARPACSSAPTTASCFQDAETNDETREYIKRKINSAQWLIDSIEQRRNTLTRVAQAIVDHQNEFLDKGPEAIEPLKMQQIADKVGVHVTTVSRAVDDKWIQTPRGIFPLKRFFCGGTISADGEEVAWDTVRLKLQEIVDDEDKQHPLSDDQLVSELAAARHHRRPPHGDQVSQGDEHSQFAPAPRLERQRAPRDPRRKPPPKRTKRSKFLELSS